MIKTLVKKSATVPKILKQICKIINRRGLKICTSIFPAVLLCYISTENLSCQHFVDKSIGF